MKFLCETLTSANAVKPSFYVVIENLTSDVDCGQPPVLISTFCVFLFFWDHCFTHCSLYSSYLPQKKKITIICKILTFNGRSKTVVYLLKLLLKHNPILLYSLALLFSNCSHLQLFLTCYYEFVDFHTMYVNY